MGFKELPTVLPTVDVAAEPLNGSQAQQCRIVVPQVLWSALVLLK